MAIGDWLVLSAPPADFVPAVAGIGDQRPSPSKRVRVEEGDSASVSGLPDGAYGSKTVIYIDIVLGLNI